jgi:asparagine synthase (glutamine-hydrolysing)
MNAALAHRGPDDSGVWSNAPVVLGHRRLSIIDLSNAGHQPMQSVGGRYVLVFNGEIYNFRELRAELSDYPFQSHTDSEVILAAYARWGVQCLSRLIGMFAFAVWDKEAQTLLIARDRLGIKPLYYCQKDGHLVFASEIRSVLASGLCARQLDQDSLVDFLRYQTVHAPHTILQGVKMLPPGHYLWQNAQGLKLEKYWDLIPQSVPDPGHVSWGTEVKTVLQRAVERRLVADVPFGAFLSGGLDSSAVVAMMSESADQAVRTFNVGFKEDEYDESRYARQMAKHCHTVHTEIRLSAKDFLDLLPEALQAMDHPSGDGPNTYVVSKVTRKAGITMALSGLGGDELFGGYSVFQQLASLQQRYWLNLAPQSLRRMAAHSYQNLRPNVEGQKTAEILRLPRIDALSAYPLYRQVLLDEQILRISKLKELPANRVQLLVQQALQQPDFQHLPLYSQISVLEIQTYLQNVLLRDTDQMSMAHALEVRVPFMDHEVVELLLCIPDAAKKGQPNKRLLVEAMGNRVPSSITARSKMGFTLPFDQWMRQELRSFCTDRLEYLAQFPFFKEPTLQQLWQTFLANTGQVSWSRIWILVALGHWLKQHEIR